MRSKYILRRSAAEKGIARTSKQDVLYCDFNYLLTMLSVI